MKSRPRAVRPASSETKDGLAGRSCRRRLACFPRLPIEPLPHAIVQELDNRAGVVANDPATNLDAGDTAFPAPQLDGVWPDPQAIGHLFGGE